MGKFTRTIAAGVMAATLAGCEPVDTAPDTASNVVSVEDGTNVYSDPNLTILCAQVDGYREVVPASRTMRAEGAVLAEVYAFRADQLGSDVEADCWPEATVYILGSLSAGAAH